MKERVLVTVGVLGCTGRLIYGRREREALQDEFRPVQQQGPQGLTLQLPKTFSLLHKSCFKRWGGGVNQVPHPKTPGLIYMFPEGNHHTLQPQPLLRTVLQCLIMEDIPSVPGLSCDPSHAKVVKLLQKDNSIDNRKQPLLPIMVSSRSKHI